MTQKTALCHGPAAMILALDAGFSVSRYEPGKVTNAEGITSVSAAPTELIGTDSLGQTRKHEVGVD